MEILEDRTLLSTWYVNSLATGGNNGQSWANAYTDLQAALTSSQLHSGDQIWVARGTYQPTSGTDRTISFALKDKVQVYGGFAGTETNLTQRDWVHNVTTLSGDIGKPGDNSDNSYHVVTATNLTSAAVLDGFTITAGNANGSLVNQENGGGMDNSSSSPTLTNLIFSSNSAYNGGGGMDNSSSSPTLTNVIFSSNSAYYGGGGMDNSSSSPTLTNVIFSSNSGGGMFNSSSSPTLTNVIFSSNSFDTGGGLYNYGSSPTLTNMIFSSNSATNGGGMYNSRSSPTLTNVIFSSNSATYAGGGMYNYVASSSLTLTNVTFNSNSATRRRHVQLHLQFADADQLHPVGRCGAAQRSGDLQLGHTPSWQLQ